MNVFFVTEHRKNYPHMHQPLKIGSKSMKRRNSSQNSSQPPQQPPQHPQPSKNPIPPDETPSEDSQVAISNYFDTAIPDESFIPNIPNSSNPSVENESPILEKSVPSTTTLKSSSPKPGDSDTGKFFIIKKKCDLPS